MTSIISQPFQLWSFEMLFFCSNNCQDLKQTQMFTTWVKARLPSALTVSFSVYSGGMTQLISLEAISSSEAHPRLRKENPHRCTCSSVALLTQTPTNARQTTPNVFSGFLTEIQNTMTFLTDAQIAAAVMRSLVSIYIPMC